MPEADRRCLLEAEAILQLHFRVLPGQVLSELLLAVTAVAVEDIVVDEDAVVPHLGDVDDHTFLVAVVVGIVGTRRVPVLIEPGEIEVPLLVVVVHPPVPLPSHPLDGVDLGLLAEVELAVLLPMVVELPDAGAFLPVAAQCLVADVGDQNLYPHVVQPVHIIPDEGDALAHVLRGQTGGIPSHRQQVRLGKGAPGVVERGVVMPHVQQVGWGLSHFSDVVLRRVQMRRVVEQVGERRTRCRDTRRHDVSSFQPRAIRVRGDSHQE